MDLIMEKLWSANSIVTQPWLVQFSHKLSLLNFS